MTVLVLPARYSEDSILMWQAAIQTNWKVRRLQTWRIDFDPHDDDIVLYGEPLFAATVADQLDLLLVEPPFDFLCSLPRKHLRRVVRLIRLAEISELDFPVFLKPADDKCFSAKVYTTPSVLDRKLLPSATPVLAAEPVTWELEVRAFVCERECQTFSIYARNGKLAQATDGSWPITSDEEDQAREYLSEFLGDRRICLPPSVVLDIGKIAGLGWAVVEANASWASGLYGCDPLQVLRTVQVACRTREDAAKEDWKWINTRVVETAI